MQIETSLAILFIIGFITILIYYSIISPKIISLDDFLSNHIIKRQIFCAIKKTKYRDCVSFFNSVYVCHIFRVYNI
jgi:hypothetical protein